MGIAGQTPYYNAADLGFNPTLASETGPCIEIVLGGVNTDGVVSTWGSYYLQAFAIYNSTMDAAAVTAITNAMNAL